MTDGSIIPFDMGRTLAFEFPRFFTSSSTKCSANTIEPARNKTYSFTFKNLCVTTSTFLILKKILKLIQYYCW